MSGELWSIQPNQASRHNMLGATQSTKARVVVCVKKERAFLARSVEISTACNGVHVYCTEFVPKYKIMLLNYQPVDMHEFENNVKTVKLLLAFVFVHYRILKLF